MAYSGFQANLVVHFAATVLRPTREHYSTMSPSRTNRTGSQASRVLSRLEQTDWTGREKPAQQYYADSVRQWSDAIGVRDS
jgi:hypothetical protein